MNSFTKLICRLRKRKESCVHLSLEDDLHPLNSWDRDVDVYYLPTDRCRSNIFGYINDKNPFIETLHAFADGNRSYALSLLTNYYEHCCPRSMADVLNIKSEIMEKIHPMATVLPWWGITHDNKLKRSCIDPVAEKLLSREAYKLGLKPGIDYGWQYFGPASKLLCELEFKRLVDVYQSIEKNGYNTARFGHIHGQFLLTKHRWVWVNVGGKHRFAALVALGYKNIPVAAKFKPFISSLCVRRDEVESWHNVRNGLFKYQEALQVFDKMVDGQSWEQ